MVSGGVSGIESRTPHGLSPSTCSGSSWLFPHTWVANGAPGATSTRPLSVLCSSSQSAVSCQYWGMALNAPGGVSRAGPGDRGARGKRSQHHDRRPRPACPVRGGRTRAATPVGVHCPATGSGPAGAPARAPAAAGSPAPACADFVAGCRWRPGTPAPAARWGSRGHPSSRGQQHDADEQHGDQPAPRRARAQRQPGQPGRGHQRGGQHRDRNW